MSGGRPIFEIDHQDGAGRLGRLSLPRSGHSIETPALMPVVNPHLQTITPANLASQFGAEIIITNAYILHRSDDLRDPVLKTGLHEVLDFPGAIMTDSGSFQLAAYGEIDVTTREIIEFQHEIGSDIATPVDIPTPPDVTRHQAVGDLAITLRRTGLATDFDRGDMLLSGPIQGSTFPSLRSRAARDMYALGPDIYPIGAVVPLMTEYRYQALVDVVAAAKRGLGADAPVHLFGAGHPMMFALAVALGCDLFDSAAYALYARDGRYLTVGGTVHVEDLREFPCPCSVCVDYDPQTVSTHPDRERLISEHNLFVTFAEIRRIRAAIRRGMLLELVEERARSHPALLAGYRRLLEYYEQLERHDPARKGTFMYLSSESARRPEVRRHHDRLDRLALPERLLLDGTDDGLTVTTVEHWVVRPPFGPIPPDLERTYPTNAELPNRADDAAYRAAVDGINALHRSNPGTTMRFVHDGWPAHVLAMLTVESVHETRLEPTDNWRAGTESSR